MKNINTNMIYNITTDRRLSSLDFRILMYFLSIDIKKDNKEEYSLCTRQESISDILNVTRENLNRSIHKLKFLGYLNIIDADFKGDYYDKKVLNVDTNEFEILNRKVRSQNLIYNVCDYSKSEFTIQEFMELMNIDVKDSKKKLLIEDTYRKDGDIYFNVKTGKHKKSFDDIKDSEKDDYILITRAKIINRNYMDDVLGLIKRFESRYNKKISRNESSTLYLSIESIILLVGAIDKLKEEIDIKIYEPIKNFREKFLDYTIEYYIKRDILKEDFLTEYNTFNKDYIQSREIIKDYIMKLLGYKNRDTNQVKEKFEKLCKELCIDGKKKKYTFIEVLEIMKELENRKLLSDFAQFDGLFNLNFGKLKEIYKL